MPVIDNQNKIIYWDEVNWGWLPYVKTDTGKQYYFVKDGKRLPVNCKEDVANALSVFGFRLESIQSLGVIEVSAGSFLYNGKLYKAGSSRIGIVRLISLIAGRRRTQAYTQLSSKGVVSKNLFKELVFKNLAPIPNRSKSIKYGSKSYRSFRSLSNELGIPSKYIRERLAEGKTIEEVVEMYKPRTVTDHLGISYDSLTEMTEKWGISLGVYYRRKNKGWSIKEILTTPTQAGYKRGKEYIDFKGNVFPSAASISKEYGISTVTFKKLLNEGKTSEEVTKELHQQVIKDHLGNVYPSIVKLADAYGVDASVFRNRQKRGWTLEEALTGKKPDKQ
jgi:hypothetical protein